ncbi:unnamed protein product [Gongylonema pulchrum]|uniref:Major capsid protein n=1 Tax=Gongylonema pulchrum TaxID=637853 RepID=A0A183ENX9_9BILA|nr:unnamed protein product [Gongylonema pulchrum]
MRMLTRASGGTASMEPLQGATGSLVDVDCTQHNPLVDLSRKVVIGGNTSDEFGENWGLSGETQPQSVSPLHALLPH